MTRICVVSDIHGDISAFYKIKKHIEKNNISDLIILGDFSSSIGNSEDNRGDVKQIVNIVGNLADIYAIPGNCDALESVKIFRSYGILCHNKCIEIGGMDVVFYGGSNTTPFGTPWEVGENIIYADLKKLFTEKQQGKTLLALHVPPKDTECDMLPGGIHVGSESIRKIIEEYAPELVVCGHIHECGGRTDTIGSSSVLNVGMLGQGNIAEITKDGIEHKVLD